MQMFLLAFGVLSLTFVGCNTEDTPAVDETPTVDEPTVEETPMVDETISEDSEDSEVETPVEPADAE